MNFKIFVSTLALLASTTFVDADCQAQCEAFYIDDKAFGDDGLEICLHLCDREIEDLEECHLFCNFNRIRNKRQASRHNICDTVCNAKFYA